MYNIFHEVQTMLGQGPCELMKLSTLTFGI